jgi:hypothetical protein
MMLHIFVLIASLATGQPLGVAESAASYPTKDACEAATPAFIKAGQGMLDKDAPSQYKIVKSLCATEADMGETPKGQESI